jgi:hypothetical protein
MNARKRTPERVPSDALRRPYAALCPSGLFCRRHLSFFPPSPPLAGGRLCSGTSQVLWACPTSRNRASPSCPCGFTARTWAETQAGHGISRLPNGGGVPPCEVLECVRRVLDHAECEHPLRWRDVRCCLPSVITTSALRRIMFSRLNRPARTSPVNASPPTLRSSAHDSGPTWLAGPSSYETFIHHILTGFGRRTMTPFQLGARPLVAG